MYAPDRPSGLISDRIAAWLSVQMAIRLLLGLESVIVCAMLRARLIPCSSAAYTVEIASVPMYVLLVWPLEGNTAAAPTWPLMLLPSM